MVCYLLLLISEDLLGSQYSGLNAGCMILLLTSEGWCLMCNAGM